MFSVRCCTFAHSVDTVCVLLLLLLLLSLSLLFSLSLLLSLSLRVFRLACTSNAPKQKGEFRFWGGRTYMCAIDASRADVERLCRSACSPAQMSVTVRVLSLCCSLVRVRAHESQPIERFCDGLFLIVYARAHVCSLALVALSLLLYPVCEPLSYYLLLLAFNSTSQRRMNERGTGLL